MRRKKSLSGLEWIAVIGFCLFAWVWTQFGLPLWLFVAVLVGAPFLAVGGIIYLQKRAREKRNAEIEAYYHALNLTNIDSMSGIDFERFVGRLLEYRGFKVRFTKATGDLGIDILAEKDSAKYAIQVKRQTTSVSRRAVSDAVAGKSHYGCNAAMVVTNNFFSKGAIELAQSTGCELVNREILAGWINEFRKSELRSN